MKYLDEFRDPALAEGLLEEIRALTARVHARRGRVAVMEVCGGHTHTIFRYGLEGLLPPELELVHGPGCPVCVLPMGRVDDAVAIARRPEVLFTTFGDAMRVPGSRGSLQAARAEGADVRPVYSPTEALALARQNPSREVVFFAIGFETTMPATALTVLQAAREGLRNFSVFCNHITILPTLEAVLATPGLRLDGLLGPGHVSAILGEAPYAFVAARHRTPFVITGFEPLDMLQGLRMVLEQLDQGRTEVENQYRRAVRPEGNAAALDAMQQVFEARPHFEWRGLGSIEESGVRLREAFATFDAERRFSVPSVAVADPAGCACGAVLTGARKPRDCPLFGTTCTPETPVGALMVSSEGSCAATYRFGAPFVHYPGRL